MSDKSAAASKRRSQAIAGGVAQRRARLRRAGDRVLRGPLGRRRQAADRDEPAAPGGPGRGAGRHRARRAGPSAATGADGLSPEPQEPDVKRAPAAR